MTVFCRDCEHTHPAGDPMKPWDLRCMKVPTRPGYKFVDPNYSPSPPYEKCERVNTDGNCKMFEPRRVAPERTAA